jgi:hypothetical protein
MNNEDSIDWELYYKEQIDFMRDFLIFRPQFMEDIIEEISYKISDSEKNNIINRYRENEDESIEKSIENGLLSTLENMINKNDHIFNIREIILKNIRGSWQLPSEEVLRKISNIYEYNRKFLSGYKEDEELHREQLKIHHDKFRDNYQKQEYDKIDFDDMPASPLFFDKFDFSILSYYYMYFYGLMQNTVTCKSLGMDHIEINLRTPLELIMNGILCEFLRKDEFRKKVSKTKKRYSVYKYISDIEDLCSNSNYGMKTIMLSPNAFNIKIPNFGHVLSFLNEFGCFSNSNVYEIFETIRNDQNALLHGDLSKISMSSSRNLRADNFLQLIITIYDCVHYSIIKTMALLNIGELHHSTKKEKWEDLIILSQKGGMNITHSLIEQIIKVDQ